MVPRIGSFFILVGIGFLVLFIGSVISQELNFEYFLYSAAAFFVGWLFRRKAAPPASSSRFGAIKRAREKSRQRREQKQQKEQREGQPDQLQK